MAMLQLVAASLAAQASPAEIETDGAGALIFRVPVGQQVRIERVDTSGNVVSASEVCILDSNG